MRAWKAALLVSCVASLSCADLISASFGDASLAVDAYGPVDADTAEVADAEGDGEGSTLPFDPAVLGNLAFWIDATTGVDVAATDAAGAPVTKWHDRSGNSRDAVPIAQGTNPPTLVPNSLNGLSVVHFTAAAAQLLGAAWVGPGGTELTMFLVTRGYSQSALRFQASTGSYPFVLFPIDITANEATADYYFYVGTAQSMTQTTTTTLRTLEQNGVELVSAVWAADGTATTYRNGVLVEQRVATNPALPDNQPLYIGGAMPPGYFANGDIAEALIYAAALDDLSRMQVEAYLRGKWGI
jgi:hypothetical protein